MAGALSWIEPGLEVRLRHLAPDAEQAADQVDKAEPLNLLGCEFLGNLACLCLPDLFGVIAEADPVEPRSKTLEAPVLEIFHGYRHHCVEQGSCQKFHENQCAHERVELEQRFTDLERIFQALPIQVDVHHLK